MRLHSLLGTLAACVLLATETAKADVIIGNGPDNYTSGGTSFGVGVLKGVGFTMTSTIYAGSARLALFTNAANASPTVYLMSDANGNPGTVLATFQSLTLTSGQPQTYLFTLPTAYQLVSGTTYWLAAAGNSNQALFAWLGDDTPTGSFATYVGARLSFNSGASYSVSGVANSFELLSAPNPSAVPEPSVAITLSAVGLLVLIRSRRRISA